MANKKARYLTERVSGFELNAGKSQLKYSLTQGEINFDVQRHVNGSPIFHSGAKLPLP